VAVSVGSRLAATSPDGGRNFQFFVVKDGAIKRLCGPRRLRLRELWPGACDQHESELASVMAHEIAHVTQHHIARQIRAQSQQSITSTAAILAPSARRHRGGGQAVEGGIVAAQGMASSSASTSRATTKQRPTASASATWPERDSIPRRWANFFETIGRHEGLAATYIPAMLVDHPVTSDRVAEARARAAQFPPRRRRTRSAISSFANVCAC